MGHSQARGLVLARASVHSAGQRAWRLLGLGRSRRVCSTAQIVATRLWLVWGISALVAMACLAEKLHHEYYWLLLAPVAAVGIGRALASLGRTSRCGWRSPLAAMLVVLCWLQVRSTWRTPAEWDGLDDGGRRRRDERSRPTPGWSRPRLSCFRPTAGAAAWSGATPPRQERPASGRPSHDGQRPARTGRVLSPPGGSLFRRPGELRRPTRRRKGLHDAVRRRYKVIVDRPDVSSPTWPIPRRTGMPTEAQPVTIPDFLAWKTERRRIAVLTAYDFPSARLVDAAGVDCILVGDSLGTVVQGWETTLRVTIDQIIYHAEMVARAARRALVVADLPFLSYQVSPRQALKSAGRILKETNCQAVKLEGGRKMAATIKAIVDADIPVMGHVGLRPQAIRRLGTYKVQRSTDEIMDDALAVAESGAFAVVLECIPRELAAKITAQIADPHDRHRRRP